MANKDNALAELDFVLQQLRELHDEAAGIIEEAFPEDVNRLKAYEVLDFGWSSNQYNTTLESFIQEKSREVMSDE